MIYEGEHSVIDAILEKKRLMDAGGEHDHIRPLLIIDGGLMKGVYGGGAVLAFEELGLASVFTSAVGISSGAPTVAYLLSGEVRKSASLFYEECCSRKFLNMWRFWNQVDTFYFDAVFRGVTGKGIEAKKVLASPVKVDI